MKATNDAVPPSVRIRPIHRGSAEGSEEVELVAARMRDTLIEVLGEDEGSALYTMAWLRDRVLWHLDPACALGEVFVAETAETGIVGHTIVRVEHEGGRSFGLFSTTYVTPSHRRSGVASALLACGESWMRGRGMQSAATDTSVSNTKLIRLFEVHGYRITYSNGAMVRLRRPLHD